MVSIKSPDRLLHAEKPKVVPKMKYHTVGPT